MCEVTLKHVVSAPHLKHVWVPDCKVVENIAFVKLNKWDRGFVRFIHNHGLNFGKRETFANSEFFDTLCRRRNDVFDKARQELVEEEERAEEGDNHHSKKRRVFKVKARAADEGILPAFLQIDLPPLDEGHEFGVGPHRANVILEGLRTQTIYIELTAVILEYIRFGVRQSELGRCRRKNELSNGAAELQPGVDDDENDSDQATGNDSQPAEYEISSVSS